MSHTFRALSLVIVVLSLLTVAVVCCADCHEDDCLGCAAGYGCRCAISQADAIELVTAESSRPADLTPEMLPSFATDIFRPPKSQI